MSQAMSPRLCSEEGRRKGSMPESELSKLLPREDTYQVGKADLLIDAPSVQLILLMKLRFLSGASSGKYNIKSAADIEITANFPRIA